MIIFVSSYDRYKYIVVSKEGWVWYLQILKGCDAYLIIFVWMENILTEGIVVASFTY